MPDVTIEPESLLPESISFGSKMLHILLTEDGIVHGYLDSYDQKERIPEETRVIYRTLAKCLRDYANKKREKIIFQFRPAMGSVLARWFERYGEEVFGTYRKTSELASSSYIFEVDFFPKK